MEDAEENDDAKDGKNSGSLDESEAGDEKKEGGHDSLANQEGHHHNARFHAAFHAKKQLRLDQRKRIVEKPPHAVRDAHTEL